MNRKMQKPIRLAPYLLVFLAVVGIFIISNKNTYGFYTFKDNTFFLLDNSLYKISHMDYKSMKEGDTIYYYEKADDGYAIKSDILIFKGLAKTKPVYVLSSKPDEVVPGERIIGTLSLRSSILGIFAKVLTSKIIYFLFLIIPLMLLMTYRFYNVITLPGEKKFIKLNEDFVPLPSFKKRGQILTRAQRIAN